MAKTLLTFEVDGDTLWDMVADVGDGGSAVGQRLAEVCIAPRGHTFATLIGLGVYGIVLKSVEPAPTPSPDTTGAKHG